MHFSVAIETTIEIYGIFKIEIFSFKDEYCTRTRTPTITIKKVQKVIEKLNLFFLYIHCCLLMGCISRLFIKNGVATVVCNGS